MESIYLNGINRTNLVTSFEIYDEINKDRIIGNAISTQIKLRLRNKDNQLQGQFGYPFIIGNKSYIVYEKPEKWNNQIEVTLYDLMIKTNINYVSKLKYPTTLSAQLDEISSLTGVSIDKSTLSSAVLNKTVDWHDETILARKYLGWIAECDGKNAFIENDKLVFKALAKKTYQTNFSSNYVLNESITITRVYYENDGEPLKNGVQTGKTLYMHDDNSYLTQTDIDRVYQMYNGLSFYSFQTFKCKGLNEIKLTDLLTYNNITLLPLSIKRKVNGGTARDSLEMTGDITLSNVDTVVVKRNTSKQIKDLKYSFEEELKKINDKISNADNGYYQVEYQDGVAIGWSIMSTPELNASTKMWKMTMGGLGFYTQGGETLQNLAFDMDGNFYADVINTGILNGECFSMDLDEGTILIGVRDSSGKMSNPTLQYKINEGLKINNGKITSKGKDSGGYDSNMILDAGCLDLTCVEDSIYNFNVNISGHHSTYTYKVTGGLTNYVYINGNVIRVFNASEKIFEVNTTNQLITCKNLSVTGNASFSNTPKVNNVEVALTNHAHSKLPSSAIVDLSTTFNFTSQTIEFDVGTITIPANCIFSFTVVLAFGTAKPRYLRVYTNDYASIIADVNAGALSATATVSGYTTTEMTYAINAIYEGSGANKAYVYGWYAKFE